MTYLVKNITRTKLIGYPKNVPSCLNNNIINIILDKHPLLCKM